MSDIYEIYDETEDEITLNGYINGSNQAVKFSGNDAQRIKSWLDQDYMETESRQAANNNSLPQRPKMFFVIDEETDDDIPF